MKAASLNDNKEDDLDESDVLLPHRAGSRLSSGFGLRLDPITGKVKFHHGVDIAAKEGAEVYPIKSGRIIFSGEQEGYGNIVMIDHGDGFITKYAHNRENLVKTGDEADTTTAIARVGSTGKSTGPHIHFEVVSNGKDIDPIPFLAKKQD